MTELPPQYVYSFGLDQPLGDPPGIEILGGKGASLAEMSRSGFPVPPGFTISTACCAWVEQHGEWPDGLETQIRAALQRVEQHAHRSFGRGPRPLFVAVRSGAAVSMPGMMDTILNCGMNPSVVDCFAKPEFFWKDYADHIRQFAASVAGVNLTGEANHPEERVRLLVAAYEQKTGRPFPTDPWESLRQSINAVFASWHSERAKTYRQHHDVRGIVGTAVNVQAMFPSERSGVLFTVDPNNPTSGEMILEASWGLGEAVVSGAVTPDIYAIDARTFETTREEAGSRPGSEPALAVDQRCEIAELGRKIEIHFGAPSDIEWGIADGRVALLQTRKIRGLDVLEDARRARDEEAQRLSKLANGEPVVWVVHNLSETLPTPTPLTWDLMQWFMSAQGGYGQMYRLLGQRPQEPIAGKGFLDLIGGRIYADPRRAAQFHFGRMPFEYDADEIARDRTALDRPPTRFNFDRTDSLFFFRLPGLLWEMVRSSRRSEALSQSTADRFQNVAIEKLEDFLKQTRQTELRTLSTSSLIQVLQRRRDFVLGEFAAESLLPGFFAGLAHDRLRKLLAQLLGPDEGEQFASLLTTGLDGDITVEQNCLLFDVASGEISSEEFFGKYGHRAVNEMELSQPRWRDDRQFVDRMIDRLRASPSTSPRQRHTQQASLRREAESSLPSRLAAAGGSFLAEQIETAMRQAQQLLPYRELGKFHLMRGYETLRDVLMEFRRRWNLGRDVFFLHVDELADFELNHVRLEAQIATRKLRWKSLQKLSLSDAIDSRRLDDFGRYRPAAMKGDHNQMSCRPIASGASRGIARVILDPAAVAGLEPDSILVCPSTDPGWTPLFVNARGLIVERGGVLSHGAIVARDFGIPAVVLEGATRLIRDGAMLDLDAHQGMVTVLTGGTVQSNVESSP